MEICEVKKDGLKRFYKIKILAKDMMSKNEHRIDEIQKVAKLPGFRSGKVPTSYLQKRFGGAVTEEVINELVREATMKLVKDEKLRPASQPKVDVKDYKDGSDLEYDFECEIFPEFQGLNYDKIKLINYIVKIPQAEIDRQIELKLSADKSFKAADDKNAVVRRGCGVKIDYEGYIGKETFEGGTAKDYQLEIGSKTFIDNFEDQLVGLKVGDHKKVKVKFPKEYHKEELNAKAAVFEVDIKEILDVIKPELNDDFAKKQGAKDLADYRKKTLESLEGYYKKQAKEQFKKELFDYVEDKVDLELPASVVDDEFKGLINQYLQKSGYKTEEEAEEKDAKVLKKNRKEYLKISKRRVKVGIVLYEIGKDNKIEVSNEEVMASLQQQMAGFPGNQEDLLAYYKNNPQALEYIRGPLLEDKVTEFIYGKVVLKDKELTVEQFQKIYND